MTEVDEIKERYARRSGKKPASGEALFSDFMVREREEAFTELLRARFRKPEELKVLEIGSGTGTNIPFFLNAGIQPSGIYANELLDERVQVLKKKFPMVHMLPGNALDISEETSYDLVFQSTVFSSILDDGFRLSLAEKMMRLTKKGGMILWYDFIFNNPSNPDVKKVTRNEIEQLFRGASGFIYRKVTLAPPIGRRVGKLYPLFNFFPFLRTHLAAGILIGDAATGMH